jgi:trans-2,3-dihydro-3-hydroxyanthranilate isomerase
MREIPIYHVDAFTNRAFGGNPAGVVPDASGLTESEMQSIARELNLSETAFLLPAHDPEADFKVRYFTPASEIDFCGHATIGAAWVMAVEYGWTERAERLVLETNIGLVPVDWKIENGRLTAVEMTQVAPQVRDAGVSAEEVARLLGLTVDDLDLRIPIRLGYTGNWHLLVPVRSRAAIDAAIPNLAELGALNRKQQAVTTHLFTLESKGADYDLYTRDFGPAVGIPEDPVTGSANGALAGYLLLEGILDRESEHHLVFAQGDAIQRPGRLQVSMLPTPAGHVIRVGGAAVLTIKGTMFVGES